MNIGPEGPLPATGAATAPARGTFSLRRFGGEAALVVGAGALSNILSYVFHFLLSRRLGPDQYGTLVTLMSIAGILGVLGASMGTVAMQETARMWASHADRGIAPFLRRAGGLVAAIALGVALALIACSLALGPYVHVTEPLLWWLLAAYVAAMLFTGFARGAAQGAHRFGIFAASMVGEGLTKVSAGFGLVALSLGVGGAIGGLVASALIALAIVYVPLSKGGSGPSGPLGDQFSREHEPLRLGAETIKVLSITATSSALLFIDMLFAKHHFSGTDAGYFGAAGTLARTLPFGVGLIALIVMPKAAAARYASRSSLAGVLGVAAASSAAAVAAGACLLIALGPAIMTLTYGAAFSPAASMLRAYTIDEALLALWLVATSYLLALARYEVFSFLLATVIIESACFALFGSTPLRLLSIAIAINAVLVPVVWTLALRTLHAVPQASGPPRAETPG